MGHILCTGVLVHYFAKCVTNIKFSPNFFTYILVIICVVGVELENTLVEQKFYILFHVLFYNVSQGVFFSLDLLLTAG